MRKKRVTYSVQCAHNPKHVFEKVYEIEDGSENQKSEVQAYCPFCNNYVTILIQGKAVPDDSIARILRRFDAQAHGKIDA